MASTTTTGGPAALLDAQPRDAAARPLPLQPGARSPRTRIVLARRAARRPLARRGCAARSTARAFELHYQPIVSPARRAHLPLRGAAAPGRRPVRRAARARGVPARGRALRADQGDRPDGARQASPACSAARSLDGAAWRSRSTSRRCRSPTRRCSRFIARRLARHGVDPDAPVDRDHRDGGDLRHGRARGPSAPGCWSSAARLALDDFGAGFGSFQYLRAAAVQPPEDRRRLHPRAARLAHRPARRAGARAASRAAWAARRSPSSSATSATIAMLRAYERRLRAGLPRRRARAASRRAAAGSDRPGSRGLAGLRELAAHRRVPGAVAEQFARAQHHLRRGRDRHPRRRAARCDRLLDRGWRPARAARRGGASGPRRRLW